MKEHGLLCTAEVVRAFLDNRKSQTRRRIRLPISLGPDYGPAIWELAITPQWCKPGEYVFIDMARPTDGCVRVRCPYAVGDLVYVRERIDLRVGTGNSYYAADNKGVGEKVYCHLLGRGWTYKHVIPSIHMPKSAARLWYPIIGVKAPERPRDISPEDAIAEGFDNEAAFLVLWQSIYGRTDDWTFPLVLGERIER